MFTIRFKRKQTAIQTEAIKKINLIKPKTDMMPRLPAGITQLSTTHNILYPLSGADVCFPLAIFPKANRIILIDQDPFISKETNNSLYNFDVINKFERRFQKELHSVGRFGSNSGWDITEVYKFFQQTLGLTEKESELGLSTLMLYRLRSLGFDIVNVEQISDLSIYKIIIKDKADLAKEIIFVQHFLGNDSLEYQWLLKQKFEFDGLLLKAYVNAISDYVIPDQLKNERKQILAILGKENIYKGFPVISDYSQDYGITYLPPFFLDVSADDRIVRGKTFENFGYDNTAFVTNSKNLLALDSSYHNILGVSFSVKKDPLIPDTKSSLIRSRL